MSEARGIGRGRKLVLGAAGGAFVAWSFAATVLVAVDWIEGRDRTGGGDDAIFAQRIAALAAERDAERGASMAAQTQFSRAVTDLSHLQARLLEAELAAAEHARANDALRGLLGRTMAARDRATERVAQLETALQDDPHARALPDREAARTLAFVTDALSDTARGRDDLARRLDQAEAEVAGLTLAAEEDAERTAQIFAQLEEAIDMSMSPLAEMFDRVGTPADRVLGALEKEYSGQGGPLRPIAMSTMGGPPAPQTARANALLERMDKLNLYRMAAEALPIAAPVAPGTRMTSPFGWRRDPFHGGARMHEGVDWAGPYGAAIHTTASGVVTFAGWQSGYGRVVEIDHGHGVQTLYAHLAKIAVAVGQQVSSGDPIGGMGNSGRSTGTHLHYEVRVDGQSVDAMTYIEAARDVF